MPISRIGVEAGTGREISASPRVSESTAWKALRRAEVAGLGWAGVM